VSNLKRIAKDDVSLTAAAISPTSAVQVLSTEEAGGEKLTGKRKRSLSPEEISTAVKIDTEDIDPHIEHSFGDSFEQTTFDQISDEGPHFPPPLFTILGETSTKYQIVQTAPTIEVVSKQISDRIAELLVDTHNIVVKRFQLSMEMILRYAQFGQQFYKFFLLIENAPFHFARDLMNKKTIDSDEEEKMIRVAQKIIGNIALDILEVFKKLKNPKNNLFEILGSIYLNVPHSEYQPYIEPLSLPAVRNAVLKMTIGDQFFVEFSKCDDPTILRYRDSLTLQIESLLAERRDNDQELRNFFITEQTMTEVFQRIHLLTKNKERITIVKHIVERVLDNKNNFAVRDNLLRRNPDRSSKCIKYSNMVDNTVFVKRVSTRSFSASSTGSSNVAEAGSSTVVAESNVLSSPSSIVPSRASPSSLSLSIKKSSSDQPNFVSPTSTEQSISQQIEPSLLQLPSSSLREVENLAETSTNTVKQHLISFPALSNSLSQSVSCPQSSFLEMPSTNDENADGRFLASSNQIEERTRTSSKQTSTESNSWVSEIIFLSKLSQNFSFIREVEELLCKYHFCAKNQFQLSNNKVVEKTDDPIINTEDQQISVSDRSTSIKNISVDPLLDKNIELFLKEDPWYCRMTDTKSSVSYFQRKSGKELLSCVLTVYLHALRMFLISSQQNRAICLNAKTAYFDLATKFKTDGLDTAKYSLDSFKGDDPTIPGIIQHLFGGILNSHQIELNCITVAIEWEGDDACFNQNTNIANAIASNIRRNPSIMDKEIILMNIRVPNLPPLLKKQKKKGSSKPIQFPHRVAVVYEPFKGCSLNDKTSLAYLTVGVIYWKSPNDILNEKGDDYFVKINTRGVGSLCTGYTCFDCYKPETSDVSYQMFPSETMINNCKYTIISAVLVRNDGQLERDDIVRYVHSFVKSFEPKNKFEIGAYSLSTNEKVTTVLRISDIQTLFNPHESPLLQGWLTDHLVDLIANKFIEYNKCKDCVEYVLTQQTQLGVHNLIVPKRFQKPNLSAKQEEELNMILLGNYQTYLSTYGTSSNLYTVNNYQQYIINYPDKSHWVYLLIDREKKLCYLRDPMKVTNNSRVVLTAVKLYVTYQTSTYVDSLEDKTNEEKKTFKDSLLEGWTYKQLDNHPLQNSKNDDLNCAVHCLLYLFRFILLRENSASIDFLSSVIYFNHESNDFYNYRSQLLNFLSDDEKLISQSVMFFQDLLGNGDMTVNINGNIWRDDPITGTRDLIQDNPSKITVYKKWTQNEILTFQGDLMTAVTPFLSVKNFLQLLGPSNHIIDNEPNNGWVSSDVMSAYVDLLNKRDLREFSKRGGRRTYFVNSFFFETLNPSSEVFDYERVRRFTSRVGRIIFESIETYYVINIANCHWVILYLEVQERRVWFYDSLHSEDCAARYLGIMKKYLLKAAVEIEIVSFNINDWTFQSFNSSNSPTQYNGYDCGVFALAFMIAKYEKEIMRPDLFTESAMPEYRKLVCKSLLKWNNDDGDGENEDDDRDDKSEDY